MKKFNLLLIIILTFLVFSSSSYADCSIYVDYNDAMGEIIGSTGPFSDAGPYSITAEPKPGFKFVRWDLDGSIPTLPDKTVSLDTNVDRHVKAVFAPATYTVSVSAFPKEGGSANKSPNQESYSFDQDVTIEATPNIGYTFEKWTEGGSFVSDLSPYTLKAPLAGNRTLVANFSKIPCVISAIPNDSQMGDVTGANTYLYGDTVSLQATAKTGYHFVKWMENGTEVTNAPAKYEFPADKNRILFAVFAENQQNQYTITAETTDNTKGYADGSGTYPEGREVTVIATANTGYHFVNWTEDGKVISNAPARYTFSADKDRILSAVFAENQQNQYTITAETTDNTKGYADGSGTYPEGREVTVIATANTGYHFVNWTEGGSVISNAPARYTFTAERDRTLVANFERNQTTYYTITYMPGTDCAGNSFTESREPGTAVLAGQSFYKNNYTQTGWSLTQGGEKKYELEGEIALTNNLTLYPYWTKNVGTLKLTVNYSGEGTVYLNGAKVTSGTVYDISELQSYTFQMTPNSKDYYVYSINFAGKYWNANVDTDKFMVTYDKMQAENRTLTIKFDSVTAPPKTGDSSNILLWSCLFGLSAAAVTTGMVLKKKSKS